MLFHDGGGDRSQTVAALPRVIDTLRAKGYQIIAVPELIGKTRAEVMLPLTTEERFEARADGFIFGIVQWFRLGIATIFVVGIVLVSGRALIIGLLAIIEKLRPDHAVLSDPPPSVTVLIPAHNEENVIVQTVSSVLASNLPYLCVIVVNDGSADRTGELLDTKFGADERARSCSNHRPQVRLLSGTASQSVRPSTTIASTIKPDAARGSGVR